jgi:hypothetical protein
MTDEVTEDFHTKVKRGDIINSPMTKRVETYRPPTPVAYRWGHYWEDPTGDPPVGSGTWHGWKYDGTWVMQPEDLGSWLSLAEQTTSDQESMIARTVTEAHARASGNEMMLLATLGEGNKTIASLCSILQRVIRIAIAIKKLDGKYLKNQISRKELEDRYMELRYALRPLVYDFKGLVAALDESKLTKRKRQTFRATNSYSASEADSFVKNINWSTDIHAEWTIERTAKVETKVSAGVLCDVELDDLAIFGVDQLLETVWELTPFSFIFDWFINIGQTIAAWTPNSGVTPLASWVTVRKTMHQVNSLAGIDINDCTHGINGTCYQDYGGVKSLIVETVDRIPSPSLSILPTMRLNFDVLKLLDLVIILFRLRS